MTKYHELQATPNKNRKRVGRGISAGQGKTAGRGTKGQSSRTGKKLSAAFMGGQGALLQRVPKRRGFKSIRVPAQVVYSDELNALKGKTIDNSALYEAGLIPTPYHSVKIIMRDEITEKVDVKTQGASKSVIAAIEKAGGTFEKNAVPLKQSTAKKAE